MSQEKVNRYKEEKANRKQLIKKQKRNRIISRIVGVVVCLAIVGWLGYSIYDTSTKNDAVSQTEVNLTAIQDYLSGLTAEETAE